MSNLALQPRIIRVGQAPSYCGMSDRVFEADIRPHLTEIKIGVQGKAFDRFELDEVLNQYIARYGRAPAVKKENDKCNKNERKPVAASMTGKVSGISTSKSQVSEFARARERANAKKQNDT